jgi:hypothetical protein
MSTGIDSMISPKMTSGNASVEPNRATLDALLGAATAQHILTRPVAVEDVFVPQSLDWVA